MSTETNREYRKIWMRNWRKNNPEKHKELQKKNWKKYKEKHPDRLRIKVAKAVKKWRSLNPEKALAHRAVFVAVRKGTLNKTPCFCGSLIVEAHHTDYSKPLDVIFLCKKHHVEANEIMRQR